MQIQSIWRILEKTLTSAQNAHGARPASNGMARKKNGNRGLALGTIPSKTKRAIVSILLIVVGAFMTLAAFGAAGIAGSDAYHLFAYLLGYGYFIVPLLFFILGGAALREESSGFTPLKIAASLLFL